MKYHVTRTSQWRDDEAPCVGAVLESIIHIDQRTKTTAEILKHVRWYERGFDHGENEIGAFRKFTKYGWFVEIVDLKAFLTEHKEVVLSNSDFEGFFEIEIYDDYRE